MSSASVLKGQCLCGAVSLTTQVTDTNVGACHCSACRRWGGGPLLSIDCGTEVTFTGEQHIGVFNSSDWAKRGFCQQCGTHLFYRLNDNNQHIVPVGLFDADISVPYNFDHQIFIEEKPAYYHFANDTKNMTGEEVFAQFAPPDAATTDTP